MNRNFFAVWMPVAALLAGTFFAASSAKSAADVDSTKCIQFGFKAGTNEFTTCLKEFSRAASSSSAGAEPTKSKKPREHVASAERDGSRPVAASAAHPTGEKAAAKWIVASNANCKLWDPFPQSDETATWSGGCDGRFASGYGITRWYQSGKLTQTWEGTWQSGRANGDFKVTWSDGNSYAGVMKNSLIEGQGTFTYRDGSVYKGQFKDNLPSGRGVYTQRDGANYEGDFVAGNFEGTGTLVFADNKKYLGEFEGGAIKGEGRMNFTNGDSITGSFDNGVPEGEGTYRWANGNRWMGTFREGTFNGKGVKYAPDGSILARGVWVNGEFLK